MIQVNAFGRLPDGRMVSAYRIGNSHGEWVEVLDYGVCIHSIMVLDKKGRVGDVCLGVANVQQLASHSLAGITVGRCANRIAYGKFTIDGMETQLDCNMGAHCLHSAGGNYGTKLFDAQLLESENAVRFCYDDNGGGGFNNHVAVEIQVSFNDAHELCITYRMTPDEATVLCPTNHTYFNLNGKGDICTHTLWLAADEYAPKGDLGMPQGAIAPVDNTPLDCRSAKAINEVLAQGADGFFERQPPELDDVVLLRKSKRQLPAAELYAPGSGRTMQVCTDMPALVLFTMYVKKPLFGKYDQNYAGYSSIALETQFVPNAVNCPEYESPVFQKGQTLQSETIYRFGIR